MYIYILVFFNVLIKTLSFVIGTQCQAETAHTIIFTDPL